MPSKSDFLPHVLRLLIEAAGQDAALAIVQKHGGARIRIPKRAEGSDLENLIGPEAAYAVVDSLADERLKIPLAKRFVNARLQDRGVTQEKRARALRVSRSTIQTWDAQRRQERGATLSQKT